MAKHTLISLFSLLILSFSSQAQNLKKVSGQVSDNTKAPMIGVNVLPPGGSEGTITDIDGKFEIQIPQETKALLFKYVGFEEKEIKLNPSLSQEEIYVRLSSSEIGLNQVIVSASKRKEKLIDAPASVTVIQAKQLETTPAVTVVDNLKKIPGVDVMMTGVAASNVTVRGFNDIFSGSLMTLVDNRIASIPSLRVNAYQLIPVSNNDLQRIELVRGPGSALYGPNASNGVLYMETKSPLSMMRKFETTVGMNAGTNNFQKNTAWFTGPDFRHAGKINDRIGYKISGSFLTGRDFTYYDPREPKVGETLIYGNVKDGNVFKPDTVYEDVNGDGKTDTVAKSGVFDRNFKVERISMDGRFDFAITKDILAIVNGGFSRGTNIELTGLGAAQAQNWMYYYAQARFKWKDLFVQYYINGSSSGSTFLIPQVNGAEPPHNVLPLVDKSKMHVVQVQHSYRPIQKLNFIYGFDAFMTRPQTDGTIHGRFENDDNVNQVGGYLQGDYDPIKYLKIVAAFRVDYHDRIKEVMISPRAALLIKPLENHTFRLTYNRAFTAPSSLNLFLDLSNGFIPNGVNARGLGNAGGLDYRYGANGQAQFISPYNRNWYDLQDKSSNYIAFDGMVNIIANGLASQIGFPPALVGQVVGGLFTGISGQNGKIQQVGHEAYDYIKDGQPVWNGNGDISDLRKVDKVTSTVTQTWEAGYKASVAKNRLNISLDFYYTRIQNYISPLTLASPAVRFSGADLAGALGAYGDSTPGTLYYNLKQASPFGGSYDDLLMTLVGLDGQYSDELPGTAWDDLVAIMNGANNALPLGVVTPESDKVNSDMILVYRNLGTVDVLGVDLGVNYQALYSPLHDLSFSLAGSFVNRDRIPLAGAQDGYVALNAPKWKASVGADYEYRKLGIGGGLTYRFADAFPANSAIYIGQVKAMHMLDLRLTYRAQSENRWINGILWSVNINNIADNQFQPFPGTPIMGRMITTRIAYTF